VRKLLAILFSLLLVWTQTEIAAQLPATRPPAATRACCECGCCVSQPSPVSAPAPAAPARYAIEQQLSTPPATSALWVLPEAEARSVSVPSSSPLIAAGAPLYERNCALLL